MKIIGIGEILWDLISGEEHLGGVPFNFAVHATRLGHDVSFVSAVGDDARGNLALAQAERHGLSTALIKRAPGHETGVVDVEISCGGQPGYSIRRPAAYDFPFLSDGEVVALAAARPDWVYFGTLQQTGDAPRLLTSRLLDANPAAGRFYDVNLRRGCYRLDLVEELLELADVVKLNDNEAAELSGTLGFAADSVERFCRAGSGALRLARRVRDPWRAWVLVAVRRPVRGASGAADSRGRYRWGGRRLRRGIFARVGPALGRQADRRFCEPRWGAGRRPSRSGSLASCFKAR